MVHEWQSGACAHCAPGKPVRLYAVRPVLDMSTTVYRVHVLQTDSQLLRSRTVH